MKVIATTIPEVKIIEHKVFSDDRGFFCELYQKENLSNKISGLKSFAQDNVSRSQRGVWRGCVFDVAVDIRQDSPTFGLRLADCPHSELPHYVELV